MEKKRKVKRNLLKWLPEHIEILKANYPTKTAIQMDALLPQGRTAIFTKAKDLGIKKASGYKKDPFTNSKKYSPETIELIKQYYPNTPVDKLLPMFPGISRKELSRIAAKLGIKKIAKSAGGPRRGCSVNKLFTPEQIQIMLDNYATSTADEMRKLLPGKTAEQIQKKAQHLKLHKSTSAIQKNNIKANQKRAYKAILRKKIKVDYPKQERKRDSVLPTKTDHYTGNKIRVNATTEIYAKPGKTAEQVISDYNAAREAAKKRLLKGPSKWD